MYCPKIISELPNQGSSLQKDSHQTYFKKCFKSCCYSHFRMVGLYWRGSFVEYIFDWKGMGVVIVEALDKYDFPVVMGSCFMFP